MTTPEREALPLLERPLLPQSSPDHEQSAPPGEENSPGAAVDGQVLSRGFLDEEYIIISEEEAALRHPVWLKALASIGGAVVNFLPWFLFAVAFYKVTLFSPAYLAVFMWMMFPSKISVGSPQQQVHSPNRPGVECAFNFRLFPSIPSAIASLVLSVVFLAALILYYFLCAFQPGATQKAAVLWALLGAQNCSTESDAPAQVMLSASWVHLLVLFASVLSVFHLKLLVGSSKPLNNISMPRRGEIASLPLATVKAAGTQPFLSWPAALSPYFWLQFLIIRVLTLEWSVAIAAVLVGCFRRCLLSIPFMCFFAVYTFLAVVKRQLYIVGIRSRPLRLSRKLFTAMFAYSGIVALTYVTWNLVTLGQNASRLSGDDPTTTAPTTPSKVQFLVTAYGEEIASNFLHCLLLGLLLSVTGMARFVRELSGDENQDATDEEADPVTRISQLETVVSVVSKYLYEGHTVLIPVLLFFVLNFCASILGIVWVLMWVLTVVSKSRDVVVKGLVCWGILHLLLVFIGGFDFASRDEDAAKNIGLKFVNATDATASFMILGAILYPTFVLSMIAAQSRQQVLESGVMGSTGNIFAAALEYIKKDSGRSAASVELHDSKKGLHFDDVDLKPEPKPQRAPSSILAATQLRANTFADLAVKRLTSVQYFIRQYFYVLAFFALFVAAIVRISIVHGVFLFLFAIIVAWRPVPKSLWGLLVVYTFCITIAIYIVYVVAPRDTSPWLVTLGLVLNEKSHGTSGTWDIWPYFVWCCFFIIQFHISRARLQEQNFRWTYYIPLLERLLAGVFCLFNCTLFALITCTQRASIYGMVYVIFFIVTMSLVMLTSLHSPTPLVYVYWRIVVALNVFLVATIYLFALSPKSLQETLTDVFEKKGFSPGDLGILIESEKGTNQSSLGLWPLVSSLMFCIVQWRVWKQNAISGAAVPDADAVDRVRIIRVVRRVGFRVNRLLEVYSLVIAACFLLIAAVSCFCTARKEISLVNVTFFLLATCVSLSKSIRDSDVFWLVLQTFTGILCLAQYVAQLPLWAPRTQSLDWQKFGGVVFRSNDGEMYQSLSPTLLVFVTAAIHVHIRHQAHPHNAPQSVLPHDNLAQTSNAFLHDSDRSLLPERDRLDSTTTASVVDRSIVEIEKQRRSGNREQAVEDQPFYENLYYVLSHPIQYFDIGGFHAVLLSLFVASVLQIKNVLGLVYFFLFVVVAAVGRDGMRRFLRWTVLWFVLFAIMILQYLMFLGNPPNVRITTSLPNDESTYLALQPSKFATIVSIVVWTLANLERISLSRRFPLYHWFFGLPCGDGVISPLTMTERLSKFHIRIKKARSHNALHVLHRLIPLPSGAEDFTASLGAMERVKHLIYKHFPTLVLLMVFVHAVYDARYRLVLTKLASLFLCLLFLQSLREAGWHGNHWWKWLFRFHTTWFLSRFLYNILFVKETEQIACALRYLNLKPSLQNTFPWANQTEVQCTWGCTTQVTCQDFTTFELWFHAILIWLIWVQCALFDRDDYAFVLHRRFISDLQSQLIGKRIRAERLRLIHEAKEKMAKNLQERQMLLERMWTARQHQQYVTQGDASHVFDDSTPRPDLQEVPKVRGPEEHFMSPQKMLDDILVEAERRMSARGRVLQLQPDQSGSPRPQTVSALDRKTVEVLSRISMDRSVVHRTDPTLGEGSVSSARFLPPPSPLQDRVPSAQKEFAPSEEVREEPGGAAVPAVDPALAASGPMEDGGSSLQPTSIEKTVGRLEAALNRWYAMVDSMNSWLDSHSIVHPATRMKKVDRPAPRFWTTTIGVYRFILSYTDRLSYILFCVQFFMSPSLVSSLLPVSVFAYAACMNPRPHRAYWSICVIYCQVVMLLKSVLKVWYCSANPTAASIVDKSIHQSFAMSDVSIGLFGEICGSDQYVIDMSLKLACMMCCTLHKNHLRHFGLWDDRELDVRPSASGRMDDEEEEVPDSFLHKVKCAAFNITREDCKTGDDKYKSSLSLELIGFVYLFVAYYKLAGLDDSVVESLKHSILPGTLAIALCVCFGVMVIDRIVYLKRSMLGKYLLNTLLVLAYHAIAIMWFVQNARLYKIKMFTFSLSGSFYESLLYAGVLYFLKMYYLYLSAMQVQSGFYSYTTHIVFTGAYTVGEYYTYWAGRIVPFLFDLRVILDWTMTQSYLKLWYFMKLEDVCHELYLLMADQEDTRVVNNAKKGNNSKPYPGKYKYPSGCLLFILLAFVLLFPLVLYSSFSPMAQTNSVSMLSASLSLEGFPPVWESMSRLEDTPDDEDHCGPAMRDSTSKQNQHPFELNTTVVSLLERLRPNLRGAGLSTTGTVQLLKMNNYSSSIWSISPPAREQMLQLLEETNKSISFVLEVSVRSSASLAMTTPSVLRQMKPVDSDVRRGLTDLLKGQTSAIRIPSLLNPFLFNKPQNDFSYFTNNADRIDCFLATNSDAKDPKANDFFFSAWCNTLFEGSNPTSDGCWNTLSPSEWTCLRTDLCPNYETATNYTGTSTQSDTNGRGQSTMYFVVLSSTVMGVSLLQSVGIVTVYATFVFAIGRVLRYGVAGGAFRIVIEDVADPTYLVDLVEFLFMVRSQKNFRLEREVYHHLMDVLRVTERLERETRKKED